MNHCVASLKAQQRERQRERAGGATGQSIRQTTKIRGRRRHQGTERGRERRPTVEIMKAPASALQDKDMGVKRGEPRSAY